MSYPPPPYKDAVCGQPVAGEAICGQWWVYPSQAPLRLGGVNPSLVVILPGVVPEAGLALGAYDPIARVIPFIQAAGLGLGATVPKLGFALAVPQAGLVLGATPVLFRISSVMHPDEAGLGLGAYKPQAELEWLLPVVPIEIPLSPVACEPLALTPAACTDLPLAPAEVRR